MVHLDISEIFTWVTELRWDETTVDVVFFKESTEDANKYI